MNQDLLFMDHTGKVLHAPIFTPLLRVLFPALLANADEIQIRHSRSQPNNISAAYNKGGQSIPLSVEPDFHWPDVFVRLKLVAGMSIADAGHQTGEIALQFQDRVIPASIEITENEKAEAVDLKLKATL